MKSVDSGNGNSLIPWRRKFSWWTGNLRKKIWAKFFFFRTLLMCKICFFVSFLYRVTHKGPCQTVFHLNSLQVPKTRNNKKRMKKSVKSSLKSRPLCVTLCKNTLPPCTYPSSFLPRSILLIHRSMKGVFFSPSFFSSFSFSFLISCNECKEWYFQK